MNQKDAESFNDLVEECKSRIEKAYKEGAKDALYYGEGCQSNISGFVEEMWRISDSKKDLEGTHEKTPD